MLAQKRKICRGDRIARGDGLTGSQGLHRGRMQLRALLEPYLDAA